MTATCVVQPIDVIKSRIHTGAEKRPARVLQGVLSERGVAGLYAGLSAGLMRQSIYTTLRMGSFPTLQNHFRQADGTTSFASKLLCGTASGALGASCSSPVDLVLTRMQVDSQLPPEQRRNYRNVLDALRRIPTSELFRGSSSTIGRAMVVNAAMLTSYSQVRELVDAQEPQQQQQHAAVQLLPPLAGGVASAFFSQPIEYLKNNVQVSQGEKGASVQHALRTTLAQHGPLGLYRGFGIYAIRIIPHSSISLFCIDRLRGYMEGGKLPSH